MTETVARETSGGVTVDVRRTVPWIIFIIFFAVLNETVFNVSTPVIAKQFHLTAAGVSWVMTTFIIFFGVGSVIYGKLADLLSLKTLIIFGIVVYSAGSVLGFAFQFSYPAVIAARAIQGAGASAIPALVNVIVARFIPPTQRGRVFGTITSTVAFAIGIGPVVGGFVSGALHWSILFAIPLFTLIAVPSFRNILPDEQRREGRIDVPGAIFVVLGVGLLMVFLTNGAWYYLAAAVLFLAGFIVDVLLSPHPFIDVKLLRSNAFRRRVYAGFILFAGVTGVLFVVPLMLSSLRGVSTSTIGLVLFPGAMCAVFAGRIGGNLADSRGNTFVFAIGALFLIASLLVFTGVVGAPLPVIAAVLVLTYIGFNLAQTALINAVSQTLDENDTGVGMGLFNLVSFVSAAVGTSLVGRYLQGNWLGFFHLPMVTAAKEVPYSNLFLVLAIAVALGGIAYFRSNRNP